MGKGKFEPGALAWITTGADSPWARSMVPCRSGYPEGLTLEPGDPVTIIRHALAKDYGILGRFTYRPGTSSAAVYARTGWLVLHEGRPVLVDEKFLRHRRYTPRRPKNG